MSILAESDRLVDGHTVTVSTTKGHYSFLIINRGPKIEIPGAITLRGLPNDTQGSVLMIVLEQPLATCRAVLAACPFFSRSISSRGP